MLTALHVPWTLAVLLESDGNQRRIGLLPVIALAAGFDRLNHSIEAVVVIQSGRILRASELEYEVLFIVQPGEDAEKVARAMFHVADDDPSVVVDHEHKEN